MSAGYRRTLTDILATVTGAAAAIAIIAATSNVKMSASSQGRPAEKIENSDNWTPTEPVKPRESVNLADRIEQLGDRYPSSVTVQSKAGTPIAVLLPWRSKRYIGNKEVDERWEFLNQVSLSQGDRLWLFYQLGPGGGDTELSRVSPKLLAEHFKTELRTEFSFKSDSEISGEYARLYGESEDLQVTFRVDEKALRTLLAVIQKEGGFNRTPMLPNAWGCTPRTGEHTQSLSRMGIHFESGSEWFTWYTEKDRFYFSIDPSSGWVHYHYEYNDTGI